MTLQCLAALEYRYSRDPNFFFLNYESWCMYPNALSVSINNWSSDHIPKDKSCEDYESINKITKSDKIDLNLKLMTIVPKY